MSAAIEAGIEGIPAIGFSLLDYTWNANFENTKSFVKTIVENVLKQGLPNGIVLNVNIPNLSKNDIKGIRICRQARGNWVEEFDKRKTPQGRDYYWLTGKFVNLDGGEDTDDLFALNNQGELLDLQVSSRVGALPRGSWVYARIEQKDGALTWSSPVFVD